MTQRLSNSPVRDLMSSVVTAFSIRAIKSDDECESGVIRSDPFSIASEAVERTSINPAAVCEIGLGLACRLLPHVSRVVRALNSAASRPDWLCEFNAFLIAARRLAYR